MQEASIGYFHNDYGKGQITRFLASIAAVYPGAKVVNCAVPCGFEVAMAARAQCYADLRKKVRGNLILCDTDIEARKPFEGWDGLWEIGLTESQEKTPLMPFNGGMIFCKDSPGAQHFLDEVRWASNIVPQGFQYLWYIDQLALGYVAKGNPAVKVFGPEYNYVPRFNGDKPDVYFMHYKGQRKSWL